MIEQALYFATGFLVALFAAVVATPVFSRRALRLASARARINAPTAEKYAAGSADALRAAHAVETVRLKHELALAEADSMRLRAMVGRQSMEIFVLRADVDDRERTILDVRSKVDEGIARRRDLEVALAASEITLYDAFAQRDRALNDDGSGRFRVGELEAEGSRDRARIAILVAQAENLKDLLKYAKADKEIAENATRGLENLVAVQKSRGAELEDRLGRTADETQMLRKRLERAEIALEEARRRLAELDSLLQRSEKVREEILIENGRRLATIADRDAVLIAQRVNPVELGDFFAIDEEEAGGAEDARRDDVALRASIKHLGREVSLLRAEQISTHQDGRGPRAP